MHCRVNILPLDSASNELVDHQVYQMFEMIQVQRNIQQLALPPSVDSIMQVHNIDYALCALHRGFSREKGNYGAQVAKGIIIGVLTLGMIVPLPIKAVSEFSVCIIDRQNQNIAFHNRSFFQDLDPVDKSVTDKQIEQLFKKYYSESH